MFILTTMGIPGALLAAVPDDDGITAEQVEEAVVATFDALRMFVTVAVGMGIGFVVGLVLVAVFRMFGRRGTNMESIVQAVARRVEVLVAAVGAFLGFRYVKAGAGADGPGWLDFANHMFLIVIIMLLTWVTAGLVTGVTRAINERVAQTSEARAARVETQTQILQRVVTVVIWILGVAAVLLTFPAARAAGASIFASAGIVSVVVGLAAQTTLGNVFAGLQLAFTDSIRVGDIVDYKGNYTTVEEITLTYVVLTVWDGRRIIVPSTIMTNESFENWTRRAPEQTGDVLIKVDWQVPIDAARQRLEQILSETDLWDGRTGELQVNDASTTEGVLLRCLVSAEAPPILTRLRNHVREEMVRWIQEEAPQAAPHVRIYQDEKGNFWERREHTEALINRREDEKPPAFEPEPDAPPWAKRTQETEIISDEDVEKLRRIPLAERGKPTGASADEPDVASSGDDSGDTAEYPTIP